EADSKLDDAKEIVDELEDKQDEIKERIERYEAEQVPEPADDDSSSGGGGGTGGGPVPDRLKGWGFDGATPRMAAIRDEIIAKFSLPYEVGCVRSSADDHGTGQACDFMMSAGGAMPSGGNQQIGWDVAEYAKANADRLGVKYVIWEQKIWDSRNPGAGWKPMEDRGSVTQNHYDHVHISSFLPVCGPPPRAPCVLPGAAAGPAAAPGPYRYAAAGSAARLRDWGARRAAARGDTPRAGKAAPRPSTPPLPLRGAPRGVGGAPPAALSPRLHRAAASRELRRGPRGDRPSPGRCAAPLLRSSWPVST